MLTPPDGSFLLCGSFTAEGRELERLAHAAGMGMASCPPGTVERRIERGPCPGLLLELGGSDTAQALELCRRLKEDPRTRTIPILCLLDKDSPEAQLEAFGAGADDCLSRPVDARVLFAHLQAIFRRYRRVAVGPAPLEAGGLRLDTASLQGWFNGRDLGLTRTEFHILQTLLQSAGTTLPKDRLLSSIKPRSSDSSSHLLETHLSNLRRKLGKAGRAKLRTVSGIGYRWDG